MTLERRKKLLKTLCNRNANVTILLDNVFDPHNIAATFRTCDSVGIQSVHILNSKKKIVYDRWSKKTSSSSNKWLDIIQHQNIDDCMAELKKKYKFLITTSLRTKKQNLKLTDYNFPESFILVMGNETTGVSEEVMKYSDINVVIPQIGIIRSLNISVSVSVFMFEYLRQNIGHSFSYSKDFKQLYIKKLDEWGLS